MNIEKTKLEVLEMFKKNNVRYDADTISAFMLGLSTMNDLYNITGDDEDEYENVEIEAMQKAVSLIPKLIQILKSEFPDYKCMIEAKLYE